MTKESLNDSIIQYRIPVEIDLYSNHNGPLRKLSLSKDGKILTYEYSHWGRLEERSLEILKINDSLLVFIDTSNIFDKRILEFRHKIE